MKALHMAPLSGTQRDELDRLYRATGDARLRTRAQMVLLAGEQGRTVPEIVAIVRESDNTILRWLKRYQAEGIEGLKDAPRPGRPARVSPTFHSDLVAAVRRRPRSLDLPYSLWTLQRLADYMAEETGVRVVAETVRQILKKHDIVLSRPQHKVSSPDPEYLVKKRRSKTYATT